MWMTSLIKWKQQPAETANRIKTMAILDCETKESAYATLEAILGLRKSEIDARLDAFASPTVTRRCLMDRTSVSFYV